MVGALFLLVFQSCSSNEDLSNFQDSSLTVSEKVSLKSREASSRNLSEYVSTQLSIQSDIKDIMDNEKNADFSMIQSEIERIKTSEELEKLYKAAKIVHIKELITLYEKMRDQSQSFRDSNADFYAKYNDDERTRILTNEIDLQLGYTGRMANVTTNCQSSFATASKRCMRNYAIEIGGSVLVGVFTGGVGGAIAGGLATAHMVACNSDAESDYHTCVRGGGIR
ncbi:hypothetical protein [Chryseobacterium paridis]|uniref:Glycine zipper family protein n=1 Tax=Chryseobacterium paridis TaxID=2800328 RepID=A0ABS1FZU7_9FLAO|nr:hypothetical protein [Chryseobacterium paridis]MBK1897968.1 hypothetical protein [Chryseobacterium paridis]